MPIRYVAAGGGRPRRLVWMDVRDLSLDHAFLGADIVEHEPSRDWFVTGFDGLRRVPEERRAAVPLRGVVFHLARCGSTLVRRLLGAIDGRLVLSEPGILNQALLESASEDIEPLIDCALASFAGRCDAGYIKSTNWNVLHGGEILDALGSPPAIFLFRDPGAILAAMHESVEDRRRIQDPEDRYRRRWDEIHETNARHLEAMMDSALHLHESGRIRCAAYENVVERLTDGDLPEFLGFEVDADLRSSMLRCADVDSKDGTRDFKADGERKRRYLESQPSLLRHRARLDPIHRRLESAART